MKISSRTDAQRVVSLALMLVRSIRLSEMPTKRMQDITWTLEQLERVAQDTGAATVDHKVLLTIADQLNRIAAGKKAA